MPESASTHDLTKRSTMLCFQYIPDIKCFNSRPHEEVDQTTGFSSLTDALQLTTSRRGRQEKNGRDGSGTCFNSRPHEEVDILVIHIFSLLMMASTHDLTKRSTLKIITG